MISKIPRKHTLEKMAYILELPGQLNQIKIATFRWENLNLTRNNETIINRLRIGDSRKSLRYLM